MNEQIQKLADEAAKYSAVMALPTGQSGNELFVEKFAELIVRECMQVLDPGEHQLIARFHARKWLAEHFGVEE
jgi:hypothetical protein